MKLRDFLTAWGLTSLKLKIGFLEGEFTPSDPDRAAAWDLYVELLTRIATQRLSEEDGDEQAALNSIHALFPITRDVLKRHGPGAAAFAKIAIPVLNQVLRPFTARWHRLTLAKAFESPEQRLAFRKELGALQTILRRYTSALAALANVEDLTSLEDVEGGV
jgi:hypothetical protein